MDLGQAARPCSGACLGWAGVVPAQLEVDELQRPLLARVPLRRDCMKIEAIVVREIHVRLRSPFETSFGTVQNRRILLVEVVADGVSGWGEVTAGETPGYNAETTDTAWHIIADFIGPLLQGKTLSCASDFPELVAHIRGQEMAKSGVENALWDAEAKLGGVSLASLLGGEKQQIDCGV